MNSKIHYQSIIFYLAILKKQEDDLMDQKENYDPERTNKIINSYRFTIKKLIEHCEEFLMKEKEDWSKLEDVSKLKRQYGKLLSSLR
jgi:hypothetical protein